MADTVAQLKTKIKAALDAANATTDPAQKNAALDTLANDLANAMNDFINGRAVTVTSVSGVTPGGGASGPGTGTVVGG